MIVCNLRLNCQLVLQEFCEDCDGRTKLVTRAPELRSNDSLPAAFERAAGERIYDGLRNGFRVRCISACCACCICVCHERPGSSRQSASLHLASLSRGRTLGHRHLWSPGRPFRTLPGMHSRSLTSSQPMAMPSRCVCVSSLLVLLLHPSHV